MGGVGGGFVRQAAEPRLVWLDRQAAEKRVWTMRRSEWGKGGIGLLGTWDGTEKSCVSSLGLRVLFTSFRYRRSVFSKSGGIPRFEMGWLLSTKEHLK